jgi:pectin methylesterase-like acyl-CoA thioesterase
MNQDAGQSGETDGGNVRDAAVEIDPVDQTLPSALRELGVLSLFPAPAARDLCADAPLHVVFSKPPTLGSSGKLQVFDSAEPRTAVATVDLAAMRVSDVRGGVTFAMERPAYVEGNTAFFYLPSRALRAGRSYFVHVDKGALRGPSGELAISDDVTWTFHTAGAPASTAAMRKVALDGTGEFCSLQGAVDAVGAGNSTIALGRGTYHGIVYFKSKRDLTIRGVNRKGTILAGVNNETLNGGTAKRALIGVDASSNITFENLTIHNRTPQGGSQAEALRMQGCDRCTVRDADIVSLQDTLLWSGRVYAKNCYIAGNVDFIWGTGAAYFDQCEIKTIGRKGYNVQARNGAGGYGYVFVDSKLTSDPGVTGNWLGRVDASVYPASHVAYIDCELGKHIDPAGWQVTGAGGGSLRFWEYRSKDPSGAPIDVSRRLAASKQLSEVQAAMMRDPSVVLGGWSPE